MILEILHDEQLDSFIFNETGKHLTIIDSGEIITTPAAVISFGGGEISNSDNTLQKTRYNVQFLLPFWGDYAFSKCHDFLDIAAFAFFEHEQKLNPVRANRVLSLSPAIVQPNDDSDSWSVSFELTVSIFY